MKKIFLCSYFAEVASILSESVSVPLRGKTVAFIPTASIHEAYTQYVEEARVAFDSLMVTNAVFFDVFMVKEASFLPFYVMIFQGGSMCFTPTRTNF